MTAVFEGCTIVDQTENSVDVSTITGPGKYVGLYFSAHWCPPCRGFTPALAEFYKEVKGEGTNLEIVFISSDQDDTSFKEYFKTMPWLALDFKNQEIKMKLGEKYGVQGIPTLILLDGATGEVITEDGRSWVIQGEKDLAKWKA